MMLIKLKSHESKKSKRVHVLRFRGSLSNHRAAAARCGQDSWTGPAWQRVFPGFIEDEICRKCIKGLRCPECLIQIEFIVDDKTLYWTCSKCGGMWEQETNVRLSIPEEKKKKPVFVPFTPRET